MSGWRTGLDKVRLTKTLQAELSQPLALAKSLTDRVLAREIVTFALEKGYSREEVLLRTLQEIGVDAYIETSEL